MIKNDMGGGNREKEKENKQSSSSSRASRARFEGQLDADDVRAARARQALTQRAQI